MELKTTGEEKVKFIENQDLFTPAEVVFDTREDSEDRTKWLSQRTNSIGGSEIGAIAGFNKYASPLTVFNDKLGLVEKFKGNVHTQFGNRMEPLIREWVQEDFKKETEIELTTYEYPYMMVDKEIPYFSANIDGIGVLSKEWRYRENRDTGEYWSIEANELFGLEIKTGSEFLKKMWAGEEVPDSYYLQCQWYMGVTGLKHFLIIYMIGKEIKWKVVPRNDDDITALRTVGRSFWENNIIPKIPPEPIGIHTETEQIAEQQDLRDEDISLQRGLLSKYKDLGNEIKGLQQEQEKAKQDIFLAMGNAKKGFDGNYKISRFTVKKDKPDLKLLKEKYPVTYQSIVDGTTEYINLRITEIK